MDRRSWSQQEDQAIVLLVQQFGLMDWTNISQKLKQRYNINQRTGKQCRQRWYNHLNPQVNKKPWGEQQQKLLFQIHRKSGNKWKLMSRYFQGRTDNDIKNHFYSTLRRSLRRLNKFIGEKNSTTQMREIKPSVLSTIMNYIYQQQSNIQTRIVDCLKDLPYLIFQFSNYKPIKTKGKIQQNKLQQDEVIKNKINFIFVLINKANQTYQMLKQNSRAVKNSKKCNAIINNNCNSSNNGVINGNNDNNSMIINYSNNSNSISNIRNNIIGSSFTHCQTNSHPTQQYDVYTNIQPFSQEKCSLFTNNKSTAFTYTNNNTTIIMNNPSNQHNNNTSNKHKNNKTSYNNNIHQQQNQQQQQNLILEQQQLQFIKHLPKKSYTQQITNLNVDPSSPNKKIKEKTVKIIKKPTYTTTNLNIQHSQRQTTRDIHYNINNSNMKDNGSNMKDNNNNNNNNNNHNNELIIDDLQHYSDLLTNSNKRQFQPFLFNMSNSKQQQRQSIQNLQQAPEYLRRRRISLQAYQDFMQDQQIGQLQQPSQVGFYGNREDYCGGSLQDLVVVGNKVVIHQIENKTEAKIQHYSDHQNIDQLIEMNYEG